jgi:protein-tyrosine-phosphatase
MGNLYKTSARLVLLLGLASVLPGCVAAGAAVGAAGVGSGVYFTSRGAESILDGPPDQVERRARAVLEKEGVRITGTQTEKSGDKRELTGTKNDLDITVTMERQDAKSTKTEVSARKNLVTWDKDYAQQLLGKIVEQK